MDNDTLDALREYFSTLDLYSGYWQVKMDPKDIDKTTFGPISVHCDALASVIPRPRLSS